MRTTSNRQLKGLSLILIIYYLGYSLFLIYQYTVPQGLFFAFSLLTFLGVGLAGLFELSHLAIAMLAIGMPQLISWFIDAFWFSFFKASLFGTAEGRFQPGLSLTDFMLGYYPLFLLPLAIVIVKKLPKPAKPPFGTTGIVSMIGLLISRYVFVGIADPNCSKLACLEALSQLPVKQYPWVYILIYTLLACVFAYLLKVYFSRASEKAPFIRFPKTCVLIYVIFCASLMTSEILRFNKIPRFSCSNLAPVSSVSTQCGYTLEYSPGFFSFFFTATNQSPVAKHCNFFLIHNGAKETMYAAVLVKSKEQITSSVVLPYPTDSKEASVSVSSECVNAE